MKINFYSTKDYENKSNWKLGENKANTKPIKPNSNLSATLQNQNKPNQSQFQTFCCGMSYEENYVL